MKSTSADVKKWTGDKFDYTKTKSSESYYYYGNEDNGYINISCKKTVDDIMVKRETWPSK